VNTCIHGQLARSCNICELEAEIGRLVLALKSAGGTFQVNGVDYCASCRCQADICDRTGLSRDPGDARFCGGAVAREAVR